jgi:hypothetical protein
VYIVQDSKETTLGYEVTLATNDSTIGQAISPLQVNIESQTVDRLHVKIFDPQNRRWEIPKQ